MAAKTTTDALIIGGGPAGSIAALRLLEHGVRPLVIEREAFPRFHIGESMTGECGGLLRQLGFEAQMTQAGHPVKHGVNVYGTRGSKDWFLPVAQRLEDGTLKDQVTWQVRRSEFDQMLLDTVTSRGVELLNGRAVEPLVADDGMTVQGVRVELADGELVDVHAPVTLDCSGQASFLANRKVTGPKYLGAYDKQIAIFGHISNFIRDAGGEAREDQPGNTHIMYTSKYHWAWAIPIDDVVTSVGIVVPAEYFRAKRETKQEFLAREIHELNPGLSARVDGPAAFVEQAHVIPNYSFQVRKFAGPGYICVGDSHRFVDPIFSFGLYIAARESGMAATAAARYLEGEGRGDENPFHEYMVSIERAIDILEDVVDTFWENPLAFAVMAHKRFRRGMIDMFAGRIYEDHGSPTDERDEAIGAMRKLLGREREYDAEGLYSVPIGSRYHPERAPLWNSQLDSVETTEAWMRDVA